MGYELIADYIKKGTKRRSGKLINKVLFIVAHDTGNPSSTAQNNVDYYKRSANEMSASAHLFVDDKQAIECIPALTGKPEKAWHVHYDRQLDNQRYGDDANDSAIGVERCYGGKIDDKQSYLNYVDLLAEICRKFELDPLTDIISHGELDPKRRSDPVNSFRVDETAISTAMQKLINDVNESMGDNVEAIKITVGNETMQGFIKDGVSYAPVKQMASVFGAKTLWSAEEKKVTVIK